MLKPKKGFVQAQLNIERLTPIQWDGIMRAMDAYAEHYHEEQVKKLNIPVVMPSSCIFCGLKRKIIKETEHFYFFEPIEGISYDYADKQLCSWIQ